MKKNETLKYKFSDTKYLLYYFYNHENYPQMHSHLHWEITIITEGAVKHNINGVSYNLKKNDVCVIRPNDIHSLTGIHGQKHSHINVVIKSELMESQLKLLGDDFFQAVITPTSYYYPSSDTLIKKCLDAVCHLQMTGKDDSNYYPNLKLLFLDLIRDVYAHKLKSHSNNNNNYPPILQTILNKMYDKNNFGMSIEELCEDSNYSHSHIIRIFRQYTQTTPAKLFNSIRLNYAKNLLETTNSSIIFIAEEIFYGISHFNVTFKKQFGVPPSAWRKNFINFLDIS